MVEFKQDFIVLNNLLDKNMYDQLIQFPLASQAMVIVYNLPELSTDEHLVSAHFVSNYQSAF